MTTLEINNLLTTNLELSKIQYDDLNYFTFEGKSFVAKPVHIYDGDTFT
jgi:hypothetical protein